MIVGAWLAAFGLADLVAGGLAAEPRSRGRIGLGVAALVGTVLAAGWFAGWTLIRLAGALGIAVLPWLLWTTLRRAAFRRARGAAWGALGVVGSALLVAWLASGWWAASPPRRAAEWLEGVGSGFEPGRFLALAGAMAFSAATANGIVRSLLAAAGTEIERSEQRLRGGRLIGVLERWLVFALAVAGELTAAAFIVSAKSILRFPEIQVLAGRRVEVPGRSSDEPPAPVDLITEYFLLGSLSSWAIALGLVVVV